MSAITSIKAANIKVMPWIVWALRLLTGGVFVMSGFVKAIDLWGFVYKTSEYFMVWDMPQPHSLYVMIALSLSMAEFMIGCMLVIGAYRRLTVWALAAMMAGLLPLTVYIYFKSPVADCGCFGDFWILSNGATLFKTYSLHSVASTCSSSIKGEGSVQLRHPVDSGPGMLRVSACGFALRL